MYAAQSLCVIHAPLRFRKPYNLAYFTTSMQALDRLIMKPRVSDKQDESRVLSELEALVENGWKLDEDQTCINKMYHFNTYTKVLVRSLGGYHDLAYIFRIFTTISE